MGNFSALVERTTQLVCSKLGALAHACFTATGTQGRKQLKGYLLPVQVA